MKDKVQVKLAFDQEYASRVLPWLKSTLMVSTYAAVFRMALNTLLLVVRVYAQGHKLIELDSMGRSVGVIHIPDLEARILTKSDPCESTEDAALGMNTATPITT